MIQYVSTFVPKMSGGNFNPHVSTVIALKDYLDKMLNDLSGGESGIRPTLIFANP
jgi:ABC-type cobalamin transport system ATPase subunit